MGRNEYKDSLEGAKCLSMAKPKFLLGASCGAKPQIPGVRSPSPMSIITLNTHVLKTQETQSPKL